MPLEEAPIDTEGQPLSPLEITRRRLVAAIPDIVKTEKTKALHKKYRTLDLARKMHAVGPAVLPLPNLAAFMEIQRLAESDPDPYAYLAEAIFILLNQQNEDVLFLTGDERRRAIIATTKRIHAHNAHHYLICISEMIEAIKKKHISSEQAMMREVANLTQQISSLVLPKPSESPIATS